MHSLKKGFYYYSVFYIYPQTPYCAYLKKKQGVSISVIFTNNYPISQVLKLKSNGAKQEYHEPAIEI